MIHHWGSSTRSLKVPSRRPLRRPKTPLWGAPGEGDQRGFSGAPYIRGARWGARLKGRLKGHLQGCPKGRLKRDLKGRLKRRLGGHLKGRLKGSGAALSLTLSRNPLRQNLLLAALNSWTPPPRILYSGPKWKVGNMTLWSQQMHFQEGQCPILGHSNRLFGGVYFPFLLANPHYKEGGLKHPKNLSGRILTSKGYFNFAGSLK